MMKPAGVVATIGLALGVGAGVAIAAYAGSKTDDDAGQDPASSSHDPGSSGVRWSPDALLPGVHRGGAAQTEWAAAIVTRLDANEDGSLTTGDAASTGSAWGASGPNHVISQLIGRYDASGDGALSAHEGASIGADVAVDGWLSEAAVRDLRAALGG